jgi:hypothetical protein
MIRDERPRKVRDLFVFLLPGLYCAGKNAQINEKKGAGLICNIRDFHINIITTVYSDSYEKTKEVDYTKERTKNTHSRFLIFLLCRTSRGKECACLVCDQIDLLKKRFVLLVHSRGVLYSPAIYFSEIISICFSRVSSI